VKLSFEKSRPGVRGCTLPRGAKEIKADSLLPKDLLRTSNPRLPELTEIEVVRHFTELSRRNFGVDTNFYPLGSCTMKYNPKINEEVARMGGFTDLHPRVPESLAQGTLEMIYRLERFLCEIAGMASFTLAPFAGAHGELTGIMVMKAYHEKHGAPRKKVIIPETAHGTNPASAALCGYEVISVNTTKDGEVDTAHLKEIMNEEVAGLMLTNPNTLGVFERNIMESAQIVHAKGGLLYYDGANLNAILGRCRPGDMGFDVMHINLHKTFATPHGGGGPGSGPVGVSAKLAPFLPVPRVVLDGDQYRLESAYPDTIGRVGQFYGNVGVCLKAFTYILMTGGNGLKKVSGHAVLNANYLLSRIRNTFNLPYNRTAMHEFVVAPKGEGMRTLDIAKALLDLGYHPPTVYFPLVVHEAIMIEPTETETKQTMDEFADTLIKIEKEYRDNPEKIKSSPHNTVVRRLDDVKAAKDLKLTYDFGGNK
jgi:glycine dehydrogenase subunit 2